MLTLVGGNVVHGSAEFAGLAPPLPPPAPDWSPVPRFDYVPAVATTAHK